MIKRHGTFRNYLKAIFFGVLFVAPFGLYLFGFQGGLSNDHARWAEFGSYLSGIYGTFAFLILAYTTNITRQQFKTQNEDNVFFKLSESLQHRVANSSIEINDEIYSGPKALKELASRFKEELSTEAVQIAKLLLAKSPELLADVHYMKIFEAKKGARYLDTFTEDKKNFIQGINAQVDFNSRWEQLKCYLGSGAIQQGTLMDALRATGSVNFYKISFSDRQYHYRAVVDRLSDDYGELLDGYFRNVCYLIEFVNKSSNKDLYVEFIKSQLTKYELVIIFYLIAGRDIALSNKKLFQDLGILEGLLSVQCQMLMIDMPSDKEVRSELDNIFN